MCWLFAKSLDLLILGPHMPALSITSLIQTAGNKMATLTVVQWQPERERERRTRIIVKNQLGVVVYSFFLFLSTGREASLVRFPLKYYSFFGCAPP